MRSKPFLWPQDPLSSASYWFFQSIHLHPSLGGNSLSPISPWHPQAQDENACSSQHPSPHQSCPFSPVPGSLLTFSDCTSPKNSLLLLNSVQTSSTYQYILILVYYCFYEYVLYCYLYSKIGETRVCLPAQRLLGRQGLNSTRREVSQYLTQCLTYIKDLFQFSVPRNRSPKFSGENSVWCGAEKKEAWRINLSFLSQGFGCWCHSQTWVPQHGVSTMAKREKYPTRFEHL